MFCDILIVFVVSLISSLFICNGSVQGFPSSSSSSSSADHLIKRYPSSDFPSSSRLLRHQPLARIESDLDGDISLMLTRQSDALRKMIHRQVSASLLSPVPSSLNDDRSNEAEEIYLQPDGFESFYRKFISSSNKDQSSEENQDENQRKRSMPLSNSKSSTLAAPFDFNSAIANRPSSEEYSPNNSETLQPPRISESLRVLLENNPMLQFWLAIMLKEPPQDTNETNETTESTPFRFGRRRK